jgi:hypothetical protein
VFGCGDDWDAVVVVQPWAGCRRPPHNPPNHARTELSPGGRRTANVPPQSSPWKFVMSSSAAPCAAYPTVTRPILLPALKVNQRVP